MNIPWEAFVALGTFALIQTCGFIWWMATITEKVNNLVSMVTNINLAGYSKKEDVDKELGKIQKDVDAAHRRIDEIQLKG